MAARLLSTAMKAVRVHKFGGPKVLTLEKDVPVPQPNDNQVLIRCAAAGVNPVDTYVCSGDYISLPQPPFTPGKDGSGTVAEVGSKVTRFKKGDRVYCVFASSGTYAEYCVAEEKYVFSLHDSLDYHQGAALGIPYFTAYRALALRCGAKAGQTVLVHGASGAVGLASCQIAKTLGLNVTGTAGTEEGLQLVLKNGAKLAFNHNKRGYIDKITEATGGVDIILEMLADVNLANDCLLCKYHGQIAVIGSRSSLDFAPRLLMSNEIDVHGVALANSSENELRATGEFLSSKHALGLLKPVVGTVYKLEDAAEAHHEVIVHSKGTKGKIIIAIE